MFIIVSPRLLRLLTKNFARAMAFYPFIFLKEGLLKENKILINHEKIHLRQQLEVLILPFYLIYLIEYLIGIIQGKSHYDSYKSISFEREAFDNETNEMYLQKRKWYSWTSYFF